MKVSVCYTIVRDVVVDVDDKFEPLVNESMPFRDYGALADELIETLYTADEIPDDCDIVSIYDDESGEVIAEL